MAKYSWILAVMMAVLFCSVGALANWEEGEEVAPPRPPQLAKVFSTNFTLVAADLVSDPETFSGFFAFNDHTGAGRLEFGGVEYIPLYLQTTIVSDPGAGLIRGYWFQAPVCWVDSANQDFLKLFPLEIPPTANFTGNKVYNGAQCSVWLWHASELGIPVEFWVNVTTPNPEGQPLAKIVFGPFVATGELTMKFTDFTVGNFSSSIYQPPQGLKCTPPPFEMTGFSYLKKILSYVLSVPLFFSA